MYYVMKRTKDLENFLLRKIRLSVIDFIVAYIIHKYFSRRAE